MVDYTKDELPAPKVGSHQHHQIHPSQSMAPTSHALIAQDSTMNTTSDATVVPKEIKDLQKQVDKNETIENNFPNEKKFV